MLLRQLSHTSLSSVEKNFKQCRMTWWPFTLFVSVTVMRLKTEMTSVLCFEDVRCSSNFCIALVLQEKINEPKILSIMCWKLIYTCVNIESWSRILTSYTICHESRTRNMNPSFVLLRFFIHVWDRIFKYACIKHRISYTRYIEFTKSLRFCSSEYE